MRHPLLRTAAPLGAAVLAAAALAAPASAAPGVIAAGGEIVYNTASVTLSNYPTGPVAVTVSRDGTVIANGVVNVTGTGIGNLNVAGIRAPEPLDRWTGFTPDILPGDVVALGASAAPAVGSAFTAV